MGLLWPYNRVALILEGMVAGLKQRSEGHNVSGVLGDTNK